MKFRIVTEFDPETNSYSASCPELPGCCSCGETEEEAIANAKEAIILYLTPCDLEDQSSCTICEVEIPE